MLTDQDMRIIATLAYNRHLAERVWIKVSEKIGKVEPGIDGYRKFVDEFDTNAALEQEASRNLRKIETELSDYLNSIDCRDLLANE